MKIILNLFKKNSLILLISLFISLTIGFFTPSLIYLTNQLEFPYLYREITPFLILISLIFFFLISIILFLIQRIKFKKAVEKLYVVIFGLGFLIWVQANFLVWNFGLFNGKLIDWNKTIQYMWIDGLLWIFTLVIFISFSSKLIKKIKIITFFLILFQFVYITYIGATFRSNINFKKYDLDLSNKYIFSNKKNIIILLLDATQSEIFHQVLDEDVKNEKILSGFKYFPDTIGGFPFTYPSIPLILTGDHYKNEVPIQEFIKEKYLNNSILKTLKNNNFSVEVLQKNYTVYYDTNIIDNIKERKICFLCKSILKHIPYLYDMSLFRLFPTVAKKYIYNRGKFRLSNIYKENLNLKRSIVNQHAGDIKFINDFKNKSVTIDKNSVFKFIHLFGSHPPFTLASDLSIRKENNNIEGYKEQIRGMMTLIRIFLEKLKEINAFDNSMIIILADHGFSVTDSTSEDKLSGEIYSNLTPKIVKDGALPLLLIKPFNNKNNFEISSTQASLEDIPKTISRSLNINEENFNGIDLLKDDTDLDRTRNYYSYAWEGDWKTDFFPPMYEYNVQGDSRSYESWLPTFISFNKNANKEYDAATTYVLGEKIKFGIGGNSQNYEIGEWGGLEDGLEWTNGKIASLRLSLSDLPKKDIILKAKFGPFLKKRVLVYINKNKVGEWFAEIPGDYEITISKDFFDKKEFFINFLIPEATTSQKDLGLNDDQRKLGIALNYIELN